jgi:heptosyltransferase-2
MIKILIEIPTWLGDAVMVTPAIENIIINFSNPRITLIGSKIAIEALKNHPQVDNTHVLNRNYLSVVKTAKKLGNFDIFFSFRGSFRAKFLKFLVKSNKKYQFNKNNYKNRHQVEKYNDFINESLSIKMPASTLILYKEKFELKSQKPLLGINPGASYGSAKQWYPEKFATVAADLSDKFDIYIFGSNSEKDIADDIESRLSILGINNYVNLAGKTSVSDLIKYISQLDLFITGDSGPMHVAASFKVPTITIFGPTKDKETSQWMNIKTINIKKNLTCQPCMQRACPLGHHECMRSITAKDVLNAVKSFK